MQGDKAELLLERERSREEAGWRRWCRERKPVGEDGADLLDRRPKTEKNGEPSNAAR